PPGGGPAQDHRDPENRSREHGALHACLLSAAAAGTRRTGPAARGRTPPLKLLNDRPRATRRLETRRRDYGEGGAREWRADADGASDALWADPERPAASTEGGRSSVGGIAARRPVAEARSRMTSSPSASSQT